MGDQIIEPLMIHEKDREARRAQRALEALREVGVQDPESRLQAYPHEFSGGMRQRVMIAMALITKPELLIADEPTTALDVTVQAQILELIRKMQQNHATAVLFITHDLGVVSGFCDKVQVMYAGQIVETATVGDIFKRPLHPYNRALQKSIPPFNRRARSFTPLPGCRRT